MSNQYHIEKFIAQYKTVFHTDWEYTSEMLGQDLYLEGETFIEGEWLTNWCNKDELDDWYIEVKEEPSIENLKKFIYFFEEVFDNDWDYTKFNLGIEDRNLDFSNGTFLNPKLTKDELEMANWGNRELLLKYYEEVKQMLQSENLPNIY